MTNNTQLADQICGDCAKKFGASMPEGHLCGMWMGECDGCAVKKEVTSVRDFRYPKIRKGQYK